MQEKRNILLSFDSNSSFYFIIYKTLRGHMCKEYNNNNNNNSIYLNTIKNSAKADVVVFAYLFA